MEIEFATAKLRKRCETIDEAKRAYGEQCARKLFQRLAEIVASRTLADLARLPAARLHALRGDREGQFAVNLLHPKRLILVPAGDPAKWRDGNIVRPERIEAVRIVEVVDYHG